MCKVEFLGISTSDSSMIILKKRKLMTFITKLSLCLSLHIYIYVYMKYIYIYIHALINRPYFGPKLLDSVPFSMNLLICFTVDITDNEGISL